MQEDADPGCITYSITTLAGLEAPTAESSLTGFHWYTTWGFGLKCLVSSSARAEKKAIPWTGASHVLN